MISENFTISHASDLDGLRMGMKSLETRLARELFKTAKKTGTKAVGEDGSRSCHSLLLPSGKLTVCYGKPPFSMGKSTISMAIFQFANCKRLPEGKA